MTEHGILPGLWPIHGDGVLARQGDLVLLIHPAGGAFTDQLLDLLGEAARARANGLRFTDLVSAQFDADAAAADAAAADAAADQQGPAVVAFGPVGGGTAVAVYGTGWAEVTTARGSQRLTAGEPYGRLRCVLPSTLIKVRAGVQAVVGDSETDPYLRLADGVVRAVALLYAPAEVRGEPADQPGPAPGLAADVTPPVSAAVLTPPPAPPAVPTPPPAPPAVLTPPPAPPAVPTPPPAPPAPEAVPEPVQQVAEPHADHIEAPEPEYYATQIEPAVASPPVPDPYAAVPPPPPAPPPPPVPDPYAAVAPPPPAPPARSAVPDPYAAQVADPYLAPPDLYAAQPPQPAPAWPRGLPTVGQGKTSSRYRSSRTRPKARCLSVTRCRSGPKRPMLRSWA